MTDTTKERADDQEPETVWLLDEYCDRIYERKTKAVNKQDEFNQKWGRSPILRFGSWRQAAEEMVYRAKNKVLDAELLLKAAKRRADKCEKIFAKGRKS